MRRTWRKTDAHNISESWEDLLTDVIPLYAQVQSRAASLGAASNLDLLTDQGAYEIPDAIINPAKFGEGYAASGVPLRAYFHSPVITTLTNIQEGMSTAAALRTGLQSLEALTSMGVIDTMRQASMVDSVTRRIAGYERAVEPGACSRCMILAGRFYRWNDGFLRHPRCQCRNIPVDRSKSKAEEHMFYDPREAFNALSKSEQDRIFGRDSAEAIRQGADMSQVVNARSGVTAIGGRGRRGRTVPTLTTSGTANRRGKNKSFYNLLGGSGPRLTPEGIYRTARNQEEALKLLRENAYILPDNFRQDYENWIKDFSRVSNGYMGKGGRAKSYSEAFRTAWKTGVRDPNELATMTTAERRLTDARLRYSAALSGTNAKEMAAAERNYLRWLSTNGQIFNQ